MDCGLNYQGIIVRYSIGVRNISLHRIVQPGPWGPPELLVVIRGAFHEDEAAGSQS